MPKLGELMVADESITRQQLDDALKAQMESGGPLGQTLLRLGFATEEQVTNALARKYGVPRVDLERIRITDEVCRLLSLAQAIRYRSLPIALEGRALDVAMVDPNDVETIDEIRFLTGRVVRPAIAAEKAIVHAIYEHLGKAIAEPPAEPRRNAAPHRNSRRRRVPNSGVDKCHDLILESLRKDCSAVHIETYLDTWRVRFRVGGVLQTVADGHIRSEQILSIPRALVDGFRLKAELDLVQSGLPQSGTLELAPSLESGIPVLLDLTWMPLVFGERLVLRRAYGSEATDGKRLFAETSASDSARDPYPGWTHEQKNNALVAAARRGDTRTTHLCLRAGADPNPSKDGYPPVWAAVMSGNASTVEALIAGGAELSASRLDRAALKVALEDGHTDCVRVLLESRASSHDLSEDEWACHALDLAASTGSRDLFRRLLALGVPARGKTLTGAAQAGHLDITSELLELRQNYALYRWDEALVSAAENGHANTTKAIIEAAQENLVAADLDLALGAAVTSGWPLKLWPAYYTRFWTRTCQKARSKLWEKVAEYGETVTLLLDAGANPNARGGSDGRGPAVIVLAAESGNETVLDTLILAGADVNVISNDGWSPVIAAVEGGHPEALRRLLEAGAEFTSDGFHRITRAHRHAFASIAALREVGEAVRWKTGDLREMVHRAERTGHSDLAELILEAGGHEEIERSVRERIVETFRSRATTLDLSHERLRTLPVEIGLLTDLEVLNLSYNTLSTLPAELRRLSKLKTVRLTQNQIVEFPEALLQLTQLETIDLTGNPLAHISNGIWNLPKLRRLKIDAPKTN